MTRRIFASLLLAFGVAMSATLPGQSMTEDPKAFWEKMIAAKGGRDRLRAVNSLVMITEGRQRVAIDPGRQLGEIRETAIYQFPDKFWQWEDTRPSRHDAFSVFVWNAAIRRSWFSYGGAVAKLQEWSEDHRTSIQRDELIYLLETRFLQPTPTGMSIDGRTNRVILDVVAPGFASIRYEVDPTSYLPTACTISRWITVPTSDKPVATPPRVTVIEAYDTVDGLQMPSRLRGERSDVSFIINPNIDPKLFETPPDGVTSRDEWRKYLRKSEPRR